MTVLASFDGTDKASTWHWHDVNDPVMGGQSKATWKISGGVGIFDGVTKIVPSLKAPGFCNAETDDLIKTAPSASKWLADSILLKVRSNKPYGGFKFSFAADVLDRQFKSYKSEFSVVPDGKWHVVAIPFANFSNDWSSFTGRCDNNPPDPTGEKHKCCTTATASVCPTAHGLDHISQLGLWTEGVAGEFHLEVQWIAAGMATGATALDAGLARPRAVSKIAGKSQKQDWTSVCTGPIQKSLRYNTSDVPSQLPGSAPDETQADAVCCDPNYKPYAEPSGFFQLPEIALFTKVNTTGINTFYDSVCGKPLFRAPIGRDFKTWHSESIEHGWPSFREEEIVKENIKVDNSTGEVLSSCGTHLGSLLPDADGARYCIDLSCISGNAASIVM